MRIKEGLRSMWNSRAWLFLTDLTESMRDTWLRARWSLQWHKRKYLPSFARA